MEIPLHKFDFGFVQKDCERTLNDFLPMYNGVTKGRTDILPKLSQICGSLVRYYTHITPDTGKAKYYFHVCQRCMKWYFRLVLPEPGQVVPVTINDEWSFDITTCQSRDWVNAGSWVYALDMAIIARDREAIQWLLEFPEERMRNATIIDNEYDFLFVDFLKAFFSGGKDQGRKLLAAYKATDPKLLHEEVIDTALKLHVPVMDLWASFLSNNEEEFNQRLEKALLLEREFSSDHPMNTFSLISYPLTAMVALAHDKGWKVRVTSGYMPDWMIKGEL
jgi:hypothetical protein